MSRKKTQEEVEKIFRDGGCELLGVYINSWTKVKYMCSCGNVSKITLGNFNFGRRCKKCGFKKLSASKTLNYEDVKNEIEENGCKLLSNKYISTVSKLKYICTCGNTVEKSLNDFRQSNKCLRCPRDSAYTHEEMCLYFKKEGCELLSKYTNNRSKLKYLCVCGNTSYTTFNSFRMGHRCKKCAGLEKLSQDFVENYFKENGCVLLDEYVNNKTKMRYKCSCGNVSEIVWISFKRGNRCIKCGGREKKTQSEVEEYFLKNGCELLSVYKNAKSKIRYKCSCGNISITSWDVFTRGCRCIKCSESIGERRIDELLTKSKIMYGRQYRDNNCRSKKPLPFDFVIYNNDKLAALIEYDGEQHFKANDFFGGEKAFSKIKKHDEIKNKYCKKNNIPLLRIPYTELKNVEQIVEDFLNKIIKQGE